MGYKAILKNAKGPSTWSLVKFGPVGLCSLHFKYFWRHVNLKNASWLVIKSWTKVSVFMSTAFTGKQCTDICVIEANFLMGKNTLQKTCKSGQDCHQYLTTLWTYLPPCSLPEDTLPQRMYLFTFSVCQVGWFKKKKKESQFYKESY